MREYRGRRAANLDAAFKTDCAEDRRTLGSPNNREFIVISVCGGKNDMDHGRKYKRTHTCTHAR